jgi:hypothetical protein
VCPDDPSRTWLGFLASMSRVYGANHPLLL